VKHVRGAAYDPQLLLKVLVLDSREDLSEESKDRVERSKHLVRDCGCEQLIIVTHLLGLLVLNQFCQVPDHDHSHGSVLESEANLLQRHYLLKRTA
jgi:hypothetical protein